MCEALMSRLLGEGGDAVMRLGASTVPARPFALVPRNEYECDCKTSCFQIFLLSLRFGARDSTSYLRRLYTFRSVSRISRDAHEQPRPTAIEYINDATNADSMQI